MLDHKPGSDDALILLVVNHGWRESILKIVWPHCSSYGVTNPIVRVCISHNELAYSPRRRFSEDSGDWWICRWKKLRATSPRDISEDSYSVRESFPESHVEELAGPQQKQRVNDLQG